MNNPYNNNFNNITPNVQNGYTANTNNNNSFYNYNKSYQPSTPMIVRPNFINNGQFIDNNIKDIVMDEYIVEYKVHIDSADRNPKYFKDPFKYTVTFNAPSSSGNYSGPPAPHINREFKNVKYLKINSITLPRYKYIYSNAGTYEYNTTSESSLYDDRFVILRIKELEAYANLTYATNIDTENSFGLIYPDKILSQHYYIGTPFFASRTFKDSQLGNIKKLTIEFLDSYGEPLKIQEVLDNTSASTVAPLNLDPLEAPDENGNFITNISSMKHPLNKHIQNHISFTFGVVESQINTHTKFNS